MPTVRPTQSSDLPAFKTILDSIDLFPSDLLEDMIADYLSNKETEDIWLTAIENDQPVGLGYCRPEQLTNGTYNLLAIGVHKEAQGKGIGQTMMRYLEDHLRQLNHRILIVDTSGTEDFLLTRKFYEQLGYVKEAVIRDYWDEGDDKVTYYKQL